VAELFIQTMAVAFELDPPYVAGPPGLHGLFDDGGHPEHVMSAANLGAVAEHAGIPPDRLRRLAGPPDGAEPVDRVLSAIGAPPAPQPVVLVQDAPDRDPFATTLPRLVHEARWPVTEEFTLTHLGADAAGALLDFLAWWMEPTVGATVILSHQPVLADADRLPRRLTAVALRLGSTGPLLIRDWRRTGARRGHACEGWPDVYTVLQAGRLAAGETFEIRSGASRVLLARTGVDAPTGVPVAKGSR
jgi:hypothetical protein